MKNQMLQKQIDPLIWKDFKQKTQNIDHLIEWAIERQNQRISDKYSSISNTVKIMKNLMSEYVKKADNLQKNLLAITRIDQIKMQSKYHEQRIKQCEVLSEFVRREIQQKNRKINEKIKQTNNLKRNLMKLKTQNIKMSMKMQEIEQNNQVFLQKENMRREKQKRITKIQEDRKMITNTFKKTNYLQLESNKLEVQLFNKIDKVKKLRQFIEDCFSLFRQKLKQKQKKSNLYGLAGSMLFKLESKQEPLFPKLSKPIDSKLLVYDILRSRYNRYVKKQNKKKEKLTIQLSQFMKFTPLQVIGVIELKGGLKNIIDKKCLKNEQAKLQMCDKVQQNI